MHESTALTSCRGLPATHRIACALLPALLIAVAFSGAQPSRADQYSDGIARDQQREAQNNSELAGLQAEIDAAPDKEAAYHSAIATTDAQIQATQAVIDVEQAELRRIQAVLDAMQSRLDETRRSLALHKRQLAAEAVVIYETENESTPLANLLSSGDFNSFWVQIIDDHRIGQIEDRTAQQIQDDELSIQSQVEQQQVVRDRKQQELRSLDAQEAVLSVKKQTQQALEAGLAAQVQADQQRIAEINASNAQLNQDVQNLEAQQQAAEAAAQAAQASAAGSPGSGGAGALFEWPDQGPITQGFGCTQFTFEPYDASCPYPHRFHNGIDIAGPCGNDIVAAAPGIAYIQPYDPYGFGNFIIVVHGSGWESLYGHMSGFAIGGGGQSVSRGQLIGWEGSTGNSTGCHLHFGLNLNGQWVNPLGYLP